LKGLEDITDFIDLYEGVEKEYLKRDESTLIIKFKQKLEDLYLEILDFLASAACHFDQNTVKRMLRNIPKIDDWEGRLRTLADLDTGCRKFATKIDSEYHRSGMKTMKDLLDEQTNTTDELLRVFRLQFNENKNIILWVSEDDVDSDHGWVREKLGSQYQNSGQWLRSWYSRWTESADKPTFWLYGSGS
jgi:hypothetical protein